MKKTILSIFFLLLLTSFLTTTHASEKLTVLLDWFANPSHAPLFVAKEKGFFHEQGLEVDLIGPANPADPPKLVAAGKADIALTYQPQFIEQADRGLPLIRIGTLVDKPLDSLVVLKNGPIKSIADLKGKRVGYSMLSINNITLKTMLEKNGLKLIDIKSININYNLTQALLSGKVDAVIGMMRTFEVIQMELAKHPARLFLPEQNGIPTYSELIFVVKKSDTQDPRLLRFLTALKKGEKYLQKFPEETWLMFAKNHPELNDELNHRAWFASLPYFSPDPAVYNAREWLTFLEFMQKNGIIKIIHPMHFYVVDISKG